MSSITKGDLAEAEQNSPNSLLLYHQCAKPPKFNWSPPVGDPKRTGQLSVDFRPIQWMGGGRNRLIAGNNENSTNPVHLLNAWDFSGATPTVVGHFDRPGGHLERYPMVIGYDPDEDVVVAEYEWMYEDTGTQWLRSFWLIYWKGDGTFLKEEILPNNDAFFDKPPIVKVRGCRNKLAISYPQWGNPPSPYAGTIGIIDTKTLTQEFIVTNNGARFGYACPRKSFFQALDTDRIAFFNKNKAKAWDTTFPFPTADHKTLAMPPWSGYQDYVDSREELWVIVSKFPPNFSFGAPAIAIVDVRSGRVKEYISLWGEDETDDSGLCSFLRHIPPFSLPDWFDGEVGYAEGDEPYGSIYNFKLDCMIYWWATIDYPECSLMIWVDVQTRAVKYYYFGTHDNDTLQPLNGFNGIEDAVINEETGDVYFVTANYSRWAEILEFKPVPI